MIRSIALFIAGGIAMLVVGVMLSMMFDKPPDLSPTQLAYLTTVSDGRKITITGRASVQRDAQGRVRQLVLYGDDGGFVSFSDIKGMQNVQDGQLARVQGFTHIVAGVSPYQMADRIRYCKVVPID